MRNTSRRYSYFTPSSAHLGPCVHSVQNKDAFQRELVSQNTHDINVTCSDCAGQDRCTGTKPSCYEFPLYFSFHEAFLGTLPPYTFLSSNVPSMPLDIYSWGSIHSTARVYDTCTEFRPYQRLSAGEGPFAIRLELFEAYINIQHVSSLIWHSSLERLRSIHLARYTPALSRNSNL